MAALYDGDVLLFDCLSVHLSVCLLWNLLSHSLCGSTWWRAVVSDTLVSSSVAVIILRNKNHITVLQYSKVVRYGRLRSSKLVWMKSPYATFYWSSIFECSLTYMLTRGVKLELFHKRSLKFRNKLLTDVEIDSRQSWHAIHWWWVVSVHND